MKKIYLLKRYKNFECSISMSILLNDCILFSGPNLGTDREYVQDITTNASQEVTAKFDFLLHVLDQKLEAKNWST